MRSASRRVLLWVISLVVVGGVAIFILTRESKTAKSASTDAASSTESPGSVGYGKARSIDPQQERHSRLPSSSPLSEEYDPVAYAQASKTSPTKIWAEEPRNEHWAEQREREIAANVEEFLASEFPEASLGSVQCKTSSCRTVVEIPLEYKQIGFEFTQITLMFGEMMTPALGEIVDGRQEVLLTTLFSKELRRREVLQRWRAEQVDSDRVKRAIEAFRKLMKQNREQ